MKSLNGIATLGAVAILCSGCGKSGEAQLEGKWAMSEASLPASKANDPGAAMAKAMMKSVTLEFTKDKKFKLVMIFPIEGDWSVSGNSVTLKPKTMMGMPVDQLKQKSKSTMSTAAQDPSKAMNATLSGDGKTLTLVSPGGKGESLVFTKSAS